MCGFISGERAAEDPPQRVGRNGDALWPGHPAIVDHFIEFGDARERPRGASESGRLPRGFRTITFFRDKIAI
jgi:hypothetical protein